MDTTQSQRQVTSFGEFVTKRVFHYQVGACLLFGVLATLFLWRVVFTGEVLLSADVVLFLEPWHSEAQGLVQGRAWNSELSDGIIQYYPFAVEIRKAILNGQLPLWYPNALGGTSLLAESHLPLYFLTDILYLFMPTAQALSWTTVIHLFLAGIFMYAYLRELEVERFGAIIAGITFAYNGHLIVWLINFSHPASIVWMPLMFWGAERAIRRRDWRWSLIGGLAFAIPLLGGNILRTAYTAGAFGLLILYRALITWFESRDYKDVLRILSYGVITGLFGIGLAAPRILATLDELYPLTVRLTHLSAFRAIPLKELVRVLAPDFYGNPLTHNYSSYANFTETNLYWGVIPLVFIFLSLFSGYRRTTWGYLGIGLFILLGVYGVTPFLELLSLYPGFKGTLPGRFLHVVAFMGAVAAGLGATTLVEKHSKRFYQRAIIGLFLTALIILLISFYLLVSKESLFRRLSAHFLGVLNPGMFNITLKSHQIAGLQKLTMFLLLAASLFWLLRETKVAPTILKLVTIGLITVDLFLAGIDYLPAFEPALLFPATPSLAHLERLIKAESEPVRILGISSDWPNNLLPGEISSVFNLQSVQGYTSFMLERYSRYVHLSNCVKQLGSNIVEFACAHDKLIDALNAKYIYVSRDTVKEILSSESDGSKYQSFELAFDGPNQIYINHDAFPRTWIVHNVIQVEKGNEEKVERLLLDENIGLRESAIVEVKSPENFPNRLTFQKGNSDDISKVTIYQPAYVRIEAVLSSPGYLVMSDNNYPGWKAYVDNEEQPVYYTNLFMRGVYLDAGVHIVEFVYKPLAFSKGLYIAGGTFLLALVGLIWRYASLRNKLSQNERSAIQ